MNIHIHLGPQWLVLLLGMIFPLVFWAVVLVVGGIVKLIKANAEPQQSE